MVARTSPKQQRKMVANNAALNPLLLRETIQKMERCMNRLQELQYTVTGGTKVISGVSLSPRSTRAYLKTSLRCKQESLRMKNATPRKSPAGKFPANKGGDWRRMSLPAMLLGETVGEILQASQFARQVVAAVDSSTTEDPKTPLTDNKTQRSNLENTELRTRRKREKGNKLQSRRSETNSPLLQRARSRINFKVSPPKMNREQDKENSSTKYFANRVSPRNRPWVRKTVLFPNPLFLSTSSCQQQRFTKTRSPVMSRKRETPHKFLIKSPPSASKSQARTKSPPASKFQVKIKSPPKLSISPTRPSKKSPKVSKASKFCRSFSPSRIVTRLASPLKGRKSVQKSDGIMSGLKQRPTSTPMRVSSWRI